MNANRYFIDTNIFLRPVVKDDRNKASDCEKIIERIRKKELKAITSSLVLAEFVWTCLSFYELTKKEVTELAKSIINIKNLKIEDKTNPLLAIANFDEHPVKFIDALIASHPKITNREMIVISYNKDFDKLKVKRIEPRELLN